MLRSKAQIRLLGVEMKRSSEAAIAVVIFLFGLVQLDPVHAKPSDQLNSCSTVAFSPKALASIVGSTPRSIGTPNRIEEAPTNEMKTIDQMISAGRYGEVRSLVPLDRVHLASTREIILAGLSELSDFNPGRAKKYFDALPQLNASVSEELMPVLEMSQVLTDSLLGRRTQPNSNQIATYAQILKSKAFDPVAVLALNRAFKANGLVHLFGAIGQSVGIRPHLIEQLKPENTRLARQRQTDLLILFGSPDYFVTQTLVHRLGTAKSVQEQRGLHPALRTEAQFLRLRSKLIEKPTVERAKGLVDQFVADHGELNFYQYGWLIGFCSDHPKYRSIGYDLIEQLQQHTQPNAARGDMGSPPTDALRASLPVSLHLQLAEFYLDTSDPSDADITLGAHHLSASLQSETGAPIAKTDRYVHARMLLYLANQQVESALDIGTKHLMDAQIAGPKNKVFATVTQLHTELESDRIAVELMLNSHHIKKSIEPKLWLSRFTAAAMNSNYPNYANLIVSAFEQTPEFDPHTHNELRTAYAIALARSGRFKKAEDQFTDPYQLLNRIETQVQLRPEINDSAIKAAILDGGQKIRFLMLVSEPAKAKRVFSALLKLSQLGSKDLHAEVSEDLSRIRAMIFDKGPRPLRL